jgi:pilus assembly protein Flp/PilA
MNTLARFMNDESGATAIEYGLIAALIAVGIIVAATALGGNLGNLFTGISNQLDDTITDAELDTTPREEAAPAT